MPTLTSLLASLNDDGLSIVYDFVESLALIAMYQSVGRKRCRLLTLLPGGRQTAATDSASPAHFITDHTTQIVTVSRPLALLLQTTTDKLLGDNWEAFLDGPEELRAALERWMVAAQTHEAFTHTARCRTTTGQVIYLFARVTPYYDPAENTFLGFAGMVQEQQCPIEIIHRDTLVSA